MSINHINAQRQNPYDFVPVDTGHTKFAATQSKSVEAINATSTPSQNQPVNLQADAKSLMATYDLTHITYGDMAKLGRALVDAGALPEDKLLDFIPLEPGRISVDGTVRESSNEPVNMIERQQAIVTSIKTFGGKGADYATNVLNMYKNFQSLHQQTNASMQTPQS